MAKKITDLAAAGALDGTELLEVVQAAANVKALLGAIMPSGYIDGLTLQWVSANALTVTSGAAYIPSLGRVLRVSASIAKAGLALTASTWYHVYLWLNGANADVEIVATTPTAPYVGTARAKTGDTSRRYLGSVLTDASGSIYNFLHDSSGFIDYLTSTNTPPFRCVAGGTATAATNVSLAGVIPISTQTAKLNFLNTDTVSTLALGNSGMGSNYIHVIRPTSGTFGTFPTDASQSITYFFTSATTGGGGYIDVLGYGVAR
jgi:hypothetical protein